MTGRIFYIIIFFICCFELSTGSLNAQWIVQPTGHDGALRDVEFINRYTGWACGDNAIFKTTNGGSNWIAQDHPDAFLIQQIFPVNENVVYACGWWNFMKTTDGGENWTAFFAGGTGQGLPVLEGLYFINENTGWLVGNVVAMKTTNGGISFVDSMRVEAIAQDVYFKDPLNGIMCGEVAGFYKTTNGGSNWNIIQVIEHGSLFDFIRLTVIHDSLVWVGSKSIYRSNDFGSTWDSIGLIENTNPSVRMYCIEFSSDSIGYAGGTHGAMYKTTNGGYDWRLENSGASTSFIRSIYGYNDSILWVARGDGTIIHTVTGGQVNVRLISSIIPETYRLHQNYPNPFNSSTVIKYEINKPAFVEIELYNVLGSRLRSLVNKKQTPGIYELKTDLSELTSGVYFYSLKVDGMSTETRKMVYLK